MSRYASPKLCGLCGRWGTSHYREADSSDRPGYNPDRDGQWVCKNDRACKRRQDQFMRGIDRANEYTSGASA